MSELGTAAFLDRDGTLVEDVGFPRDPDLVQLVDGAADALRRLAADGLRLVVISNQSGIGRGLITPDEARAVHERFVAVLAGEGITLDAAKYCPHAPDAGCDCRKPSPAMLLEAADEMRLDLGRSFMIGDKLSDSEAGRRAGCRGILITHGSSGPEATSRPDFVAADWNDAVRFILDARGSG